MRRVSRNCAGGSILLLVLLATSPTLAQDLEPLVFNSGDECTDQVNLLRFILPESERGITNTNRLEQFCQLNDNATGAIMVATDGTFSGEARAETDFGTDILQFDPPNAFTLGPVRSRIGNSPLIVEYFQGQLEAGPSTIFTPNCPDIVLNPDLCVASPILIDFGRPGFGLTDIDTGVRFDIDGDGRAEQTSWTQPGAEDAFLALDRNGNGQIDGGAELFGNATPLRDGSTAAHGYVALAEWDQRRSGGNANGYIDPGDDIFDALRLWTDTNHNGVSEAHELTSLRRGHVLALSLDFERSDEIDEHGNIFALLSSAYVKHRGRIKRVPTTDVFFLIGRP